MGVLVEAYHRHAQIAVAGVRKNYDLDEVPERLTTRNLPCIIPVLPTTGETPAQEIPTTTSIAHADLVYNPLFYVLVELAGAERGLRIIQPNTLDVYEAYLLALRQPENKALGSSSDYLLSQTISLSAPQFGVIDWPEGTSYVGFRISHTWRINIR